MQEKVVPARRDRQVIRSIFGGIEQVLEGLAVSAVSGYDVSIAAGRAVVLDDSGSGQAGMYHVFNDAPVIKTITPHATLPRIDRVVFRVYDSAEIGSGPDQNVIEIVPGTATSGANLTNETGIPLVPNTAISLAKLLIDAVGGSISAGDIEDDRLLFRQVAVVTSLPANPVDGQEVFYVADATNGVVWHLKYRAASASAYKWEFVGGGQLHNMVAAAQTTSSTSYVDLTTTGPQITVPLAGDYDVRIGADLEAYGQANNLAEAWMSYAIGGTAASDAWGIKQKQNIDYATRPAMWASNAHAVYRQLAVPAAALLIAKYKVATQGPMTAQRRTMTVVPVRVG